jgi:hypothetical protein
MKKKSNFFINTFNQIQKKKKKKQAHNEYTTRESAHDFSFMNRKTADNLNFQWTVLKS